MIIGDETKFHYFTADGYPEGFAINIPQENKTYFVKCRIYDKINKELADDIVNIFILNSDVKDLFIQNIDDGKKYKYCEKDICDKIIKRDISFSKTLTNGEIFNPSSCHSITELYEHYKKFNILDTFLNIHFSVFRDILNS